MVSDIFVLRFKYFVEPTPLRKSQRAAFLDTRYALDEKLLYEILRSDIFFDVFGPPFHFFVLFFTATVNPLRWKAVNRDMYLNIPLVANWHAITTKREHVINTNLMRKNKKHRRFDYQVNKKVLKELHDPTKLGIQAQGPYKIKQVHIIGTLTMELRPGIT